MTLNDYFCVNALHQTPETFNTEQESQDTGTAITGTLKEKGIQISMDGKGRCMGNIFIEGLWRSVKHEKVLLEEFTSVPKLLRQQANTAYI